MASAQEERDTEARYRPDEVPTCSVSSASRTREACGVDSPATVRTEREVTLSLELAKPTVQLCQAAIQSEYVQRDTFVSVEQVIDNASCGASSGTYEVEVQIEDQAGERRTLVFGESWQRDDDLSVVKTASYPLGDSVELIRLRSRGVSCSCAGTTEAPAAPDEEMALPTGIEPVFQP